MNLTRNLCEPRNQSTKTELPKRIGEIDDLRGLAVVFMALVHVQNIYSSPAVMESVWATVVDFLGGPPAAPVFMMIMGMFFTMSSRRSFRTRLRRGLLLLLTGYLLNFLRGVVPVFIGTKVFGLSLVIPEMFTFEWLLFNVDILIFAGLAYIIMALCTRISTRPVIWLTVACASVLVAPFLWGVGEQVPVLKRFVQPLWSADPDLATFPVFPWIWFPLFGMVVGDIWYRSSDRKALIKPAVIAGSALFIVGLGLVLIDSDLFFQDYGQMRIGGIIGITGFVILWGLGVAWISARTRGWWKVGIIGFLGRNLTTVYVIHWLILGWSLLFIPADSLGYVESVLMAIGVLALSSILTRGLHTIQGLSSRISFHRYRRDSKIRDESQ